MLRNLWSYLSGITIECLTACEDDIYLALLVYLADAGCDGGGGCAGICAAKYTVT